SLATVVGACAHERLILVCLQRYPRIHRDPGRGIDWRHEALDRAHLCGEHPDAEIDQMGHVMPEKIVRPAPAISRGTDVLESVEEEPAGDWAHPLAPRLASLLQSDHLRAEAKRMHDAEYAPSL